jgi:glycosyltransferase involved in cell wall biosynthesis
MPPLVSVIVPCYNEQGTIRSLLEALFEQTYPREGMEVIVADGLSVDGTREEITAFQLENPDLQVRVIDNPMRSIPAGLNQAIRAARGEIIVRLDAHSMPNPDYVSRSVEALNSGMGDNIGGVWEICPGGPGWQAQAIAVAAAHPFGVGDARYRLGGQAQEVDTVPFGAFRRSLIDQIGPFDETLLTNEDYEFNARLRQAGGRVWLDPAIQTTYFARGSFAELARQYWRYGYWKARMLRRYPGTLRWRQIAGLFVLSFLILGLAGFWYPLAWQLLLLEAGFYVLTLVLGSVQVAYRKGDGVLLFSVPLAIAIMHFSWGTGFLWSLVSSIFRKPSSFAVRES